MLRLNAILPTWKHPSDICGMNWESHFVDAKLTVVLLDYFKYFIFYTWKLIKKKEILHQYK